MKTIYTFLIIGLFSGISNSLWGQEFIQLETSTVTKIDENLTQTEIDTVVAMVERTLNKYASVATLYDESAHKVNEKSQSDFYSVFNMNLARVMEDYKRYPPSELIDPDNYAMKIEDFFFEGFEFEIQNPKIVSISNFAKYYTVHVELSKKVFAVIGANGVVEKDPSGIVHEQDYTFDINKSSMEVAKITEIRNAKKISPAEDFTNIIQFGFGVGTSIYNPTQSDYWNSNSNGASLDVSGGLDFSIGIEFVTNKFITAKKSADRKLALSAGLTYSSFMVNTEINSYNASYDAVASNNTGIQKYQRLTNLSLAEEQVRYSTIQIPLGIGMRMMEDKNMFINAFFKVIPAFVIGGKGNITGNSNYDGILYLPDDVTLSDFRILDPTAANQETIDNPNNFGPYNVGDKEIDLDTQPDLASTLLTLQLSPTAYFKFENRDPVWGIFVGLDIGYQFSSFTSHDPITSNSESPFQNENDFSGSLLNYFTTDMSGFHFSVKVGLFRFSQVSPN